MRLFRSSLLLGIVLAAALPAQQPTPLVDPEVRRIGEQLRCMCGSCNYTVTSCNMMSCSGADYGRNKLKELVDKGLTEEAIKAEFVKEFGVVVLTKPPSEGFSLLGWVMPFVAIGVGLLVIWWVVRRYMGNKTPVPTVDAEVL
ncbi:MAG: cytochrome c-type biogenesis protein CcmH, partial [bacterium]|nr:cytochrome c-type biogenesis protein CcmH [bacterium]